MLLDGRRPLLGEGVPRGAVGEVLDRRAVRRGRARRAAGDAARSTRSTRVMVPFGGGEHDWAALELAAVDRDRARTTPLKLLGARGAANGGGDASDVLNSASLVVQQLAGVQTEAVLVDLANDGLLRATEGAGLLVIGLSERWRDEGLGPVRSAIAKAAPAPILFVRRGTRPGALAPAQATCRVRLVTRVRRLRARPLSKISCGHK